MEVAKDSEKGQELRPNEESPVSDVASGSQNAVEITGGDLGSETNSEAVMAKAALNEIEMEDVSKSSTLPSSLSDKGGVDVVMASVASSKVVAVAPAKDTNGTKVVSVSASVKKCEDTIDGSGSTSSTSNSMPTSATKPLHKDDATSNDNLDQAKAKCAPANSMDQKSKAVVSEKANASKVVVPGPVPVTATAGRQDNSVVKKDAAVTFSVPPVTGTSHIISHVTKQAEATETAQPPTSSTSTVGNRSSSGTLSIKKSSDGSSTSLPTNPLLQPKSAIPVVASISKDKSSTAKVVVPLPTASSTNQQQQSSTSSVGTSATTSTTTTATTTATPSTSQPKSSQLPPSSSSSTSATPTPAKAPGTGRTKKPPKTQLELTYPPYILPEDKSIDDARARLKKAIEQTRSLREAFTDRLYDKYRVVLRPVPKSGDAIIGPVMAQPKAMRQQLMQQISVIQAEKDTEKKISQKINAELSKAGNAAETAAILGGLTGIDNAEQLGWFGAGLNLVILPEEDINEAELAARGIKERSPVDPETGHKVRDLSSAAAVAASAMLDRVRKGADIRRNRIRKQQDGTLASDLLGDNMGLGLGLGFLPSPGASFLSSSGSKSYAFGASSPSARVSRNDSHTSSTSGKFGKSKTTGSLSSLLNMSAETEGMRPNRKPSAAAYALMNNSVKKMSTSALSSSGSQSQPRHPFPQSKGARSSSYGHTPGKNIPNPLSLPTLAVANERKRMIKSKPNKAEGNKAAPREASVADATKSIVKQFIVGNHHNGVNNSTANGKSRKFGLKRKVSEIGILHNVRDERSKKRSAQSSRNTGPNDFFDPLLVFSVMQTLGFLEKSASSSCVDSCKSVDCLTINDTIMKRIRPTAEKIPLPHVEVKMEQDASKAEDSRKFCYPSNLIQTTILDSLLYKAHDDAEGNDNQRNMSVDKKKTVSNVAVAEVKKEEKILTEAPPKPLESLKPAPVKSYIPSLRGGGDNMDDEQMSENISSGGNNIQGSRTADGIMSVPSGLNDVSAVNASIWNDQANHQGLPQDTSSMMSQQQAYAMMTAGMRTADPITSGLYSQSQQQSNNLAAAMNINSMQAAQHHSNLQHTLNGEQFRRHNSYQSVNNHQLHLAQNQLQAQSQLQAQNQLQQAAAALQSGHMLRPNSSDMNDYFNAMHPLQMSQAYPQANPEWSTIATQHGVLSTHPSAGIDPTALGLTPHQAALLIRDRTTQALLAREQQQLQAAQVAAAHQNALAMSQAAYINANVSSFGSRPQTSEVSNSSIRMVRPNSTSRSNSSLSGNKREFNSTSEKTKKNVPRSRPSSAPEPKSKASPKPSNFENSKNSQKIMKSTKTTSAKKNISSSRPIVKAKIVESKPLPDNKNIAPKPGKSSKNVIIRSPPPIDSSKLPRSSTKKANPQLTSKSPKVKEKKSENVVVPSKKQAPVVAKASISTSKSTSENKPLRTATKVATLPVAKTTKATASISPKMSIPSHSSSLNSGDASLILKGSFHEAARFNDAKLKNKNVSNGSTSKSVEVRKAEKADRLKKEKSLVEYLLKVGAAVPIPGSHISTMLKTRLNTPFFRSTVTTLGSMANPSEVMEAVITTWLWANHKDTFERSFSKNSRKELNSQCKWLLRAAVEKSTNESVAKELERIVLNNAISDQNDPTSTQVSLKLKIAKMVSKSLNSGVCVSAETNSILPNIDALVDHLDQLRTHALRTRCQERVLLASLISKRTRMSEAFSNAYTSSIIRAGEVLGYDEVGEIVQNEITKSSSQMPFDILSDASGAWEDPCRPLTGFSKDQTGDELMKRAHARAMIQRSLKKLQDRHQIKGGTSSAGPYSDSASLSGSKGPSPSPPSRPSPRASHSKRRSSSSGIEGLKGMSSAATAALFAPNHHSVPFILDVTDSENKPYGRHEEIPAGRHRSPSSASRGKRMKTAESGQSKKSRSRNTSALDWLSVAEMFQNVTPVEKPNKSNDHDDHNVAVPLGSKIFAPFCRKMNDPLTLSDHNSDSEDDEEDLNDDHILEAHQKVLDTIKDKFDTMMRIRQEYQDRSRKATFGR